MTNLNTPELQGALDCLAMLLLQPEAENAVRLFPLPPKLFSSSEKTRCRKIRRKRSHPLRKNRPLNPLNCRKPMRSCFWEQAK